MKKFLILLTIASGLSLSACDTPLGNTTINPSPTPTSTTLTGTDTGTTITSRFSTKAQFISWLSCLKNQIDIDAQTKSQFDLYISAINIVPEGTWSALAQQYAATLDSYSTKYYNVCQ